ncbi:MAG: hypothetical protein Q7T48_21615 [Cellvibrio sp.]|uniref:hypothetical protein n=1 Tax=Cellvibrio sp. TaxID=1965322 RepID=UPI00272462A3|nr:hypothetical protein [Cellvibrio sp.]
MLKNIFKKEKPRVYLGTLAVVPRTGIKKSFDSWDLTRVVELDGKLKETLTEVFCLPPSNSRIEVLESDLVLDVLISEFQLGAALLPEILFPILWRPKVTLVSKLSNLNSGKTKRVLAVTEKMPWAGFFSRLLTFQGLIGLRPSFNVNDLEKLLYIGSEKVFTKLKNSI